MESPLTNYQLEKAQHTAEDKNLDLEKVGDLLFLREVCQVMHSYHSESDEARFPGLCGPSSLLSEIGVGVANQLFKSSNQAARLVLLNGIPETRQRKNGIVRLKGMDLLA